MSVTNLRLSGFWILVQRVEFLCLEFMWAHNIFIIYIYIHMYLYTSESTTVLLHATQRVERERIPWTFGWGATVWLLAAKHLF